MRAADYLPAGRNLLWQILTAGIKRISWSMSGYIISVFTLKGNLS